MELVEAIPYTCPECAGRGTKGIPSLFGAPDVGEETQNLLPVA